MDRFTPRIDSLRNGELRTSTPCSLPPRFHHTSNRTIRALLNELFHASWTASNLHHSHHSLQLEDANKYVSFLFVCLFAFLFDQVVYSGNEFDAAWYFGS